MPLTWKRFEGHRCGAFRCRVPRICVQLWARSVSRLGGGAGWWKSPSPDLVRGWGYRKGPSLLDEDRAAAAAIDVNSSGYHRYSPARTRELGQPSIGIRLKDQNDNPVIGSRVRVKLPDGKTKEGTTNSDGELEITGLSQDGNAHITLFACGRRRSAPRAWSSVDTLFRNDSAVVMPEGMEADYENPQRIIISPSCQRFNVHDGLSPGKYGDHNAAEMEYRLPVETSRPGTPCCETALPRNST